MSQRGFGQAPDPADDGMERRRDTNGRQLDRDGLPRSFGDRRNDPQLAWDDQELGSGELDRYLEDRARLAGAPRRPADLEERIEPRAAPPGSRWSSPSRRRRRERPSTAQNFPDESPTYPAFAPTEPDPESTDWATSGDPYAVPPHQHFNDRVDPYLYDDAADLDFPAPTLPARRSRRVTRPRPTIVMPQVRMPASVAESDLVRDPVALGLLGGGLVLALVSALVAFSRIDDLPSIIELRYDAYGTPSRWGPPKSLWQLPLLVTMVTIINLVLAASLSRRDRFASRFLLASALVVGLLAWVPLARFLW